MSLALRLTHWFSLDELTSLTGKLTIDSRQARQGDWLVLCLPAGELSTERMQAYSADAASRGATAVVVDAAASAFESALPVCRVANLRAELPKIASAFWGTAARR